MPRALRAAVAGLVLVGVVVMGLWTLQRKLIYFPAGTPPPVDAVLPSGEEVTVTSADGLDLRAWWVPGGATAAVVFPGNAGNRAGRVPLAEALHGLGLSVLLVDYRGYGGNPGSPTEEGLLRDARAAAGWVEDRPDVRRLVYFGESLGAAVAVGLATDRSPDALVLRSPFTSLVDMARAHYGPVPSWLLRDRFPSRERIDAVDAPLLVLATSTDEIVPIEQSRRLFEAADDPKRFVEIGAAGHNDPALFAGEEVVRAIERFLADHGLLP